MGSALPRDLPSLPLHMEPFPLKETWKLAEQLLHMANEKRATPKVGRRGWDVVSPSVHPWKRRKRKPPWGIPHQAPQLWRPVPVTSLPNTWFWKPVRLQETQRAVVHILTHPRAQQKSSCLRVPRLYVMENCQLILQQPPDRQVPGGTPYRDRGPGRCQFFFLSGCRPHLLCLAHSMTPVSPRREPLHTSDAPVFCGWNSKDTLITWL